MTNCSKESKKDKYLDGFISADRDIKIIDYRVNLFYEYIRNKNEKVIDVFTHSGFIKYFSEKILKSSNASSLDYSLFDREANLLDNTNFLMFMID